MGAGDSTIQGFATDISVNRGETVFFKVATNATNYRIDIYRLGYYDGDGARKVATIQPSASLPQSQPVCLNDPSTGIVDCGNWAVSASWDVPEDAVSGIYIARPRRNDTGGASHIVFVVRDDAGDSDLLFQTSDTTWQAYNQWGGADLYNGNGPAFDGRAYKVSYNRPFSTRSVPGGGGVSNWLFYSEYPMVRWLEANGYDVSYFTNVDADRFGSLIQQHRVFLSVGHDEYWSAAQRANVEAARDAGVHLAFFSGNEVFWKIRWEDSIDSAGNPYRTLVCYKETKAGAKIDPSPEWTGTWRDPTASPPSDGGRPENALTGTLFTVNRGSAAIRVPAEDGKMRFWRNTSVANQSPGGVAILAEDTLGYEWDEDVDNGFRPAGSIRMSTTVVEVPDHLIDYGNTYVPGIATHHLTLSRAPSGALTFGAGTIQWSWGLDTEHDIGPDVGPSSPDIRMQQATVNLFADMGVQPATPQAGIAPASASSDSTPPASSMTAPAAGGSADQGTPVTISGSATDTGGRVGGVEVSTDGGSTWHPANGRQNWSYTFTPDTPGELLLLSRAADDSGNIESPGPGRPFTVNPRPCPCSVWDSSATPATPGVSDAQAIEVGVKVQSAIDGYITGVRFYKHSSNEGPHVANLWAPDGTQLATTPVTDETSSGWQQALFPAPVPINANVTYTASYHAPVGRYSLTAGDLSSEVVNYPLRVPSSGTSGGNGVFRYGSSAMPTNSFNSSNYWVDVVFETTANDTIAPAVTGTFPSSGAGDVAPTTHVSATFSEPVNASTILFELRDPAGSLVAGAVSYDTPTRTATFTPGGLLAESSTYTATVSGAADLAGNAMSTPAMWNFTTLGPASSLFGSAQPAIPAVTDPSPVEVGLRFQSDIDGYINGVRFYKGASNTGPHTGHLWSETGELLGTTDFTNETPSGWQQALFQAPIPVTAGATYVVSYHTASGNYALSSSYFGTSDVTNYPLRALANTGPGNGVYKYGAPGFPSSSYNGSNYWVDALFSSTFTDTVPPAVLNPTPGPGAVNVSPLATVTVTFGEPVETQALQISVQPAGGAALAGSIQYDPQSLRATFTPQEPLEGDTEYTVNVSGAVDASENAMAPAQWSFHTVACPCTIFAPTDTPDVASVNDPSAVEVGLRIRAEVDGHISGVRFYKGASNTGTHVGKLWSETGALLASVTFANETASGWQHASFPAPVPVTAGTTYVISYFTSSGFYSASPHYFGPAGLGTFPLSVLPNSGSSANGVYRYGGGFPTDTYSATNYWVDAVFELEEADAANPAVVDVSPEPAGSSAPTTAVSATFSEAVNPATLVFELRDPGGALVSGSVTYDPGMLTARLTPSSPLAEGATYTATVTASDVAGNPMTAPFSWQFSILLCPCSIWPASAQPAVPAVADPSAVEVGVKFRAQADGFIAGARFFKGAENTGVHTANLWRVDGTLLATATFTNETATGWQEVLFATPVPVSAGDTYVVSYHTTSGFYSATSGGLASAVTAFPLEALASGTAGGNGVYVYGGGGFPVNTWNSTNYWVDVVFVWE